MAAQVGRDELAAAQEEAETLSNQLQELQGSVCVCVNALPGHAVC